MSGYYNAMTYGVWIASSKLFQEVKVGEVKQQYCTECDREESLNPGVFCPFCGTKFEKKFQETMIILNPKIYGKLNKQSQKNVDQLLKEDDLIGVAHLLAEDAFEYDDKYYLGIGIEIDGMTEGITDLKLPSKSAQDRLFKRFKEIGLVKKRSDLKYWLGLFNN